MMQSKTPDDGVLDLPGDASLASVLEALEIDPKFVQIITVNGSMDRDHARALSENDEVFILPVVGGG
ncbi:MAG: MoaD/ThiS family protein [Planctomycetales bacterium]